MTLRLFMFSPHSSWSTPYRFALPSLTPHVLGLHYVRDKHTSLASLGRFLPPYNHDACLLCPCPTSVLVGAFVGPFSLGLWTWPAPSLSLYPSVARPLTFSWCTRVPFVVFSLLSAASYYASSSALCTDHFAASSLRAPRGAVRSLRYELRPCISADL